MDPMNGEQRAAWSRDETTLGELGRALFAQPLAVSVYLPGDLARQAVAAWEREDTGEVSDESPEDRRTRGRASALALIGLAVQRGGVWADDDTVTVPLDAWHIGTALDAADDLGLLDRLSGGTSE
jgi:hypothetical protein